MQGTILVERPAGSLKTKMPSSSGKSGNEGIRRVPPKTVWRTGLILLFAEKCSETFGADECSQTVILTSASSLIPPSQFFTSGIGTCSRYSGATVPDFNRIPRHLTAMGVIYFARFKERSISTRNYFFAKLNF